MRETAAAAVGGTTTVAEMPLNASPVTTTVAALKLKLEAAKGKLHVNVGFYGGVIPSNIDDLDELLNGGVFGIKAFLTHSGIDEFPNVTEADLRRALPILKKHDILFIADEVITGFGRTGHWFATGGMKLEPDIVTLAKGITSAHFPVSASVISEKIWNVLRDASPEMGPVMHGFTYSGHPVGGALGLTNLAIMERENLIENAAEVGPYLQNALTQATADCPYVGEVRGMGQMIAIEYVADRKSKRFFNPKANAHRLVAAKALAHGVMTRALPFLETTSFSPPLTMNKSEADEAVERYTKGLKAALPDLEKAAAM